MVSQLFVLVTVDDVSATFAEVTISFWLDSMVQTIFCNINYVIIKRERSRFLMIFRNHNCDKERQETIEKNGLARESFNLLPAHFFALKVKYLTNVNIAR